MRRSAALIGFALGVLASPAQALSTPAPTPTTSFSKSLAYTCYLPYLGETLMQLEIDGRLPSSSPAGTVSPEGVINSTARFSDGSAAQVLDAYGAASIEGSVSYGGSVSGQSSPFGAQGTFPRQAIEALDALTITSSGILPAYEYRSEGPATWTVDRDLFFDLYARDAAGEPVVLPQDEPQGIPAEQLPAEGPGVFRIVCLLNAGQDASLATVQVTSGPPTTQTPSPTPLLPPPTPAPSATPTPTSSPTTTPEPTVTPAPTVTPQPTRIPEPECPVPSVGCPPLGPSCDGNAVNRYAYALAGSATVKTLTKGSAPLAGSLTVQCRTTSGFSAELALAPTTASLTALGFLPVVAKITLVPTEPVSGTLIGGKLAAVAKLRIKLPSVKALGIELAGGATCQAKQISSVALTSTQPNFQPVAGGPVAGTFSISDLSGCGFLTGIVSPLTKGSGNAIALNLTPTAVA